MKIVWTEFAVLTLKEIFKFYREVANKKIATTVRKEIILSTKRLSKNPKLGQNEILLKIWKKIFAIS